MVEFTIPNPFPRHIYGIIPEQRSAVEKLFQEQILLTYTLSLDRTKLWSIFISSSESELISYIDRLPMTPYFDYDYKEVMYHDTIQFIPSMSLN